MNARFALCLVAFLGLPAYALTVDGIAVKGIVPATAKEMVHIKSVTFARGMSVEGAANVLVVSGVLVSNVKAVAPISVVMRFTLCVLNPPTDWLKSAPLTITVEKPAFGIETKFSGIVDAPAYNEKLAIGYAVSVEVKPYEAQRLKK